MSKRLEEVKIIDKITSVTLWIFCMPLYDPKGVYESLPEDKKLDFVKPRENKILAKLFGKDWKQNVRIIEVYD